MTNELIAAGWKKFYECDCDGSLKQHYAHKEKKGYEIVVRPAKNTFRIKLDNFLIGGPYWGYELQKKMAELIK